MGLELPPLDHDVSPLGYLLAPDTILWRVHTKGRVPGGFKPSALASGRFDCTDDDPYPSLYLAFDEPTALTEVLLRSVPFGRRGHRYLPYETVRNRQISAVRTTRELRLVDLRSGRALAAACQDEWLVHCEERHFGHTRQWASWLRERDPAASGFVWWTRRNLSKASMVLFGDRPTFLEPAHLPTVELGTEGGLVQVNEWLRQFRASVAWPKEDPDW
ncbi:RES family NAD+ phosphorylase [Nonomuraea sp. NPDC050556]|uniref:RES family NAD+ phosphorylase n=1 Tax=Nonomuraea sp. NPDC050556 TaxID=3364369 RepID=UPI003789E898